MSELFVQEADGRHVYPHFADGATGYLPGWGESGYRHPLRDVEKALGQNLHTTFQPLRLLSFQVGQINYEGRKGPKIAGWEREVIAEAFDKLEDISLERPQTSWKRADFAEYYRQVRAAEAKKLRGQVIELAGHIVAQNQIEQLYVAREAYSPEGSGWLAPLMGLSIDTTHENDYCHQAHDVIPVVRENNGEDALLRGATVNLYTAYAPRKGVSK